MSQSERDAIRRLLREVNELSQAIEENRAVSRIMLLAGRVEAAAIEVPGLPKGPIFFFGERGSHVVVETRHPADGWLCSLVVGESVRGVGRKVAATLPASQRALFRRLALGDCLTAESVGELASVPPAKLRDFIAEFIESRPDAKDGTRRQWQQAQDKLVAYFGPDKPLAEVSKEAASDWLRSLRDAGLAAATMKRLTGDAKRFFADAVDHELIPSNPFGHSVAKPPKGRAVACIDRMRACLAEHAPAGWRIDGNERIGWRLSGYSPAECLVELPVPEDAVDSLHAWRRHLAFLLDQDGEAAFARAAADTRRGVSLRDVATAMSPDAEDEATRETVARWSKHLNSRGVKPIGRDPRSRKQGITNLYDLPTTLRELAECEGQSFDHLKDRLFRAAREPRPDEPPS